ncbi:MAG: hypothetical protein O2962_02255 [Cyanobacteria bacterium]|nr:hypothetical protein [Cyanobacteriota bacterium]
MNIQAIEHKKAQLASKNQSLAEQGLLRQLFTSSIHGQTEINLSDDMAFLDNQEAIVAETVPEFRTAARAAPPPRFQLAQLVHEERMSFSEPRFMIPSFAQPSFMMPSLVEPSLEEANQNERRGSMRNSRAVSQAIVMAELIQEEELSSGINTEYHYRIQADQVDNQFVDIDKQIEAQRIISMIRIESEATMFDELKTIVQEQINNETSTDNYYKSKFENMLNVYKSSLKRVQAGTTEHQTLLQLIDSVKMKLGEYS